LLSNEKEFSAALEKVLGTWKNSCEHYLTNEKMNRIAWLGQASLCVARGIPSCYRSGYFLLSKDQQKAADAVALAALNKWLMANQYQPVDMEGAGVSAQANIY
jgi:hypothetical protein